VPFTILVTTIMVAGTLPQFAVGSLGPLLVDDFDLSRAQFGTLTTATFSVAAVLSLFVGAVTEKLRPRGTYCALFLASALTFAGMSLATTYPVLLAFVALAGVGQALVNPLSNRLIAQRVRPERQGLVTGIKQSGVHIGGVVGGVSFPVLAVLLGWRGALAGAAVLFVVACLATVRLIPQAHVGGGKATEASAGMVASSVRALAAYAFMMGSGYSSVITYLPLYAHEAVGVSSALAGTLLSAMGVIGVTSRIVTGHAADRARNLTLILAMLALAAAGAMLLVLLAASIHPLLLLLGALLVGSSAGWNTVVMITVVKRAGRQGIGKASGHVMSGFFAGFIFSPVIFGFVVDVTGGYTVSWAMFSSLLFATSVAVWVWDRRSGTGP
jgi:predicted MFS family arabinose efflux permease